MSGGVKGIKAGGDDDGPYLHLDEFVLLLIVDGARRADRLTHAAGADLEVEAVFAIDDGHVGHRLGEGNVDIAPAPQSHVKVEQQRARLLVGHVA